MSHILIAEDDADIADLVAHHLGKAGHSTEVIGSGPEALSRVRASKPDVLILDLMLPGMDGLDICRSLRSDPRTADVTIIMLTARGEETDRIVGLEVGADDYVSKPFSPKELVARVGAVQRRVVRSIAAPPPSLTYGTVSVDVDRHTVLADRLEVRLTALEFRLLQYLLEHRGRVLTRDRLLSDVWGYSYTGNTRTVDVHIRRLREKIPTLAGAIETVKQFGYMLTVPAP
jgi:DNA-binding response OmpR family regulator